MRECGENAAFRPRLTLAACSATMQYDHTAIEGKWQQAWRERNTYRVDQDFTRPKFYVLDMFPYLSGAGLHVGHPLGYIASDIVARTSGKRASTCCTPWATTPSACLPSSTPSRPASTPRRPPR